MTLFCNKCYFQTNPCECDINEFSYEEQIRRLKIYGFYISDIKKPTFEQKLIAIDYNPSTIFYMDNPGDYLKKVAIQKDYYLIYAMTDPSVEVQKFAIKISNLNKNIIRFCEIGFSEDFETYREEIEKLVIIKNVLE